MVSLTVKRTKRMNVVQYIKTYHRTQTVLQFININAFTSNPQNENETRHFFFS